jgi:hypothetical protein
MAPLLNIRQMLGGHRTAKKKGKYSRKFLRNSYDFS